MSEETIKTCSLAEAIASTLGAYRRCVETGNKEWAGNHEARLASLCDNLPHGSGIDSTNPERFSGLDIDASSETRLVINLSFHHMNGDGYYDGWTEHTVVVTPTFGSVAIRVSGRNRNDIKEYLSETYYCAMTMQVKEY